MNAKEMFEKLGYKGIEVNNTIEYYTGEKEKYKVIRFWKDSKHIELFGEYYTDGDLDNYEYYEDDYKLFNAINKQIEELGWLEGE